ncbi:MAG: hypothetical protein ABFS19_00610 [Thermodesulfobacteriota bacterium]
MGTISDRMIFLIIFGVCTFFGGQSGYGNLGWFIGSVVGFVLGLAVGRYFRKKRR